MVQKSRYRRKFSKSENGIKELDLENLEQRCEQIIKHSNDHNW